MTPHASAGGLGRHDRNATVFLANLSAHLEGRPLEHLAAIDDLSSVLAPPAQFQAR